MLLDADDVLQVLPQGWRDVAREAIGDLADHFPTDSWHDDPAALRGARDFLTELADRLTAAGTPVAPADLAGAVPPSVATVPEALALVPRLRAAGYGVHLGTSQEQHRAAYMRGSLGYDEVFDVSCYSCDLGVLKPEIGFFVGAAARIDAEPATILFIDDRAANVEGARAAGLPAEQWAVDLDAEDRNIPALLDLLARHDVVPAADPVAR